MSEYIINKNQLKNNIFEIKLKGIKQINNMSNMFEYCSSLFSLPNILKWNSENVTKMSHMFSKCSSLKSLEDI